MSPIVSIIVPCYNQAYFLKESLQSVLDQSYAHWECIIVNDGSPDDTAIVAKQWCERNVRFQYVEQSNGGLSSARNAGIRVAKGEFILPLDADDILDVDYLMKTVPELEQNRKLGIVSCYTRFFKNTIADSFHELKPQGDRTIYLHYVNQLVATSLYRKECWSAVGGYDETMKKGFEDWEFWLNVTKRSWDFKIIPEFLFYYRKAQQSMLMQTIESHAEDVKQYIFTKHKELYIKDFDNCMEVLFYELKVQKKGHDHFKNSIEYKIGKVMTKPYRVLLNWLKKRE
ncbi:glycosyltransferase family 2 protein [Flavobacterium sp. GNP002]